MNIDFSAARFKHLNWRFRIRNFLDGKDVLTREQAVSHKDCDLGKWLYADGLEKYGHIKEMHELEKVHEELHNLIKKVLIAKDESNVAEAEFSYRQMLGISDSIMAYLDMIEKLVSVK